MFSESWHAKKDVADQGDDMRSRKGAELVVRGTVRTPDGRAADGLLVRAFDGDVQEEDLLGEVTTDDKGEYAITYTTAPSHHTKTGPQLILHVYSRVMTRPKGKAKAVEVIDLLVPALAPSGLKTYQRIYNLAGSPEAMEAILLAGYTSREMTPSSAAAPGGRRQRPPDRPRSRSRKP